MQISEYHMMVFFFFANATTRTALAIEARAVALLPSYKKSTSVTLRDKCVTTGRSIVLLQAPVNAKHFGAKIKNMKKLLVKLN